MLAAYLGRGKDRNERRRRSHAFNVASAPGLLAFHQTNDAHNFKPQLAGSDHGLIGGCAGGTHIIHNDYARAWLAKAFNALYGAVSLLRFAHQEAIDMPPFPLSRTWANSTRLPLLRAQDSHPDHDWI